MAAATLGDLRAREAVAELTRRHLEDNDAEVKKAAARALAVIEALQ